MILDCKKNELKVGDCIRSIETSWHGQIQSTYEDEACVMLVCKGINFWDGSLDEDDTQYFSADDVVKWSRAVRIGDPVNASNLL